MNATPTAKPERRSGGQNGARPLWPVLLLPALHLLAALPLIVLRVNRSRGAYDSINYHEKMIRDFIAQWPRPDFHDYLSVTTPLYHVILAALGRYVSDSVVVLQLAGMVFTLGLLGLLVWGCRRWTSDARAVASVLPVAACVYVFSAGVWLLPDNAGWLGCVAIVLIALRAQFDRWTVIGGGSVLLALVLTRQIHLWAAAPLVVAAWVGGTTGEGPAIFGDWRNRAGRAAIMLAATLPAIAALGYFVWLWGGLTPPTFRNWFAQPYNAATPAFILMLFGLYGAFFAPMLAGPLMRLARERPWVVALVVVGALVVCALPHTSRDSFAGRYSGLWEQLVARVPVRRERSPVVIGLGVLGAVWLAGWMSALAVRDRLVLLAALAGFVAAQSASFWVWQRYTEPMVLVFVAVFTCRGAGVEQPDTPPVRRLVITGPIALAGVLAAITAVTVAWSGVVKDEGYVPGKLPPPPQRPASPAPTIP